MPPRPSRSPTSLHLASLGSPFALLTGLPSASSFCFPAAVLPLTPSHTRRLLSFPRLSRHTRARDRESPASRPPSRSHAPSFLFLLSVAASSPSLSAAPFARLDLTLLFSSRTLVLLLLPVPPRPPPPSILIDRSCTRAPSASPYHLVSSPSTRSCSSLSCVLAPSSSSSFFLSFCLLSFRRLFLLRSLFNFPPLDSLTPSHRFTPCSCARRGINYSKNLYCYYYRLTIPSARDVHSSPVQCATLFAPCRYVNPTTARATTATTGRRCLVPLW